MRKNKNIKQGRLTVVKAQQSKIKEQLDEVIERLKIIKVKPVNQRTNAN